MFIIWQMESSRIIFFFLTIGHAYHNDGALGGYNTVIKDVN